MPCKAIPFSLSMLNPRPGAHVLNSAGINGFLKKVYIEPKIVNLG